MPTTQFRAKRLNPFFLHVFDMNPSKTVSGLCLNMFFSVQNLCIEVESWIFPVRKAHFHCDPISKCISGDMHYKYLKIFISRGQIFTKILKIDYI